MTCCIIRPRFYLHVAASSQTDRLSLVDREGHLGHSAAHPSFLYCPLFCYYCPSPSNNYAITLCLNCLDNLMERRGKTTCIRITRDNTDCYSIVNIVISLSVVVWLMYDMLYNHILLLYICVY